MDFENCGTVIIHRDESTPSQSKTSKNNTQLGFSSKLQSFNASHSEVKSDYSNFVNFMKKMPANEINIQKILEEKAFVEQKIRILLLTLMSKLC